MILATQKLVCYCACWRFFPWGLLQLSQPSFLQLIPRVFPTCYQQHQNDAMPLNGSDSSARGPSILLPRTSSQRLSTNRILLWHPTQDRLGYSAKPELLPLVRLSRDLPPFRARALLKAGYPSPLELATADAARVADVLLRCAPFRSAGWDESVVRSRGRLLRCMVWLVTVET